MLRKIICIKNVGRFVNYSASGDVTLRRYNLIFAENGRGKTTLCSILRSVQSGDSAYVVGRKTLGGTGDPEVNILADQGNVVFGNGKWNKPIPEIAIFDSTFVSENVHSGDVVGLEHRRSLYSVIVGEEGVKLAKQIEALDDGARVKSADIREKRVALQVMAQGITPEDFLAIEEDAAIDDKMAAKQRDLEAATQASQIKTRAGLSAVSLPAFPQEAVAALLAKTIEGVAADAEQRVIDHVNAHNMHGRGQAWLAEGISFIQGDKCPFCNQRLDAAAAVIKAYKDFFSKAYNDLRTEIATVRRQMEMLLGDREIANIDRIIDQNTASVEFWGRYCEITAPVWEGKTGDALRVLRNATIALLDRKSSTPLEGVVPDTTFTDATASLEAITQTAASYNRAVRGANAIIDAKKTTVAVADISAIQKDLATLRRIKARYAPGAVTACKEYNDAQLEKKTIEEKKAAVRVQLDEYSANVICQYERTINQLLEDFQAGFRITGTGHSYPGGVPSSTYQILINNTPVDLGDAGTPLDEASFRNTLSAGDKSTLALAFFLAQLAQDSGKAAKIVVFDDPFNSQDNFRKDCTIQKIKKCGENCAQVLVLSHDQSFLKRIWDRLYTPADRKCLEMARIGQYNTTICEWDIEKATQDQYKADRKALRDYYQASEGKQREVIQKIRPVLETYCKNLGGSTLSESDTLGVMVGKIRAAGIGHQLFPLCDGLEELNEYTRRYHHGENTQAATEPITDTELQGYVRRTLEMTGGC